MKKLIAAVVLAFGLFEAVYAGTYQPQNLGWVNLSISSGTVTEITRSTAPTIGYLKWCTNCITNGGVGTMCISTGTANWNQFILSTGTVCK